jgi:hypothetical protein
MHRKEQGSCERLIRYSATRPPSSVGAHRRWDEPLARPIFFFHMTVGVRKCGTWIRIRSGGHYNEVHVGISLSRCNNLQRVFFIANVCAWVNREVPTG